MIEITPFLSITLVSIGLSVAITIIYRALTNPDEVRKLKEDTKFYKEKMNQANKEGDRAKANQYASEMIKCSQKQLRMSMKPMMATMLLFFLLLGWLHGSFGGVKADVSGEEEALFSYGGEEHRIYYDGSGEGLRAGVDFNGDGEFSDGEIFDEGEVFAYKGAYWRPVPVMEGILWYATPKNDSVHFEMFIAKTPFTMPFLGNYLSWFWWYIFISLPATFALRKLMGVE
jgi:uncharacterized membrane protein (DUF106 family)